MEYNGIASSVGPNGENAYEFTFNELDVDGITQFVTPTTISDFYFGVYVRAVSGTQDVYLSYENAGVQTNSDQTTIDTTWQWVEMRIQTPVDRVSLRSDQTGSIYVLRAGLNRGSSLAYTTRQTVEQTIPDVIGDADLINGSVSSVDANDFDFAVDGSGVRYAVSDGMDETSVLANGGDNTWAVRLYVPSGIGDDVHFVGDTSYNYPTVVYDHANSDLRVRYRNSNNNVEQGPRLPVSKDMWHTIAFTVYGNTLRIQTTNETDTLRGAEVAITATPKIVIDYATAALSHLEVHEPLSEYKTKAVVQAIDEYPKTNQESPS